ncbi:hypothetical protein RhiJN_17115 [Ceratobasidium sp. AG-Ba]|nr:hypothetical protein RhiJN_17115 [Ceratobasidium sp. AG-Ba]
MCDTDTLSISSLRISNDSRAPVATPLVATTGVPDGNLSDCKQTGEDNDVALLSQGEQNDHAIEMIRRIATVSGNKESKHSLRIDCCVKILSETPITSPIESPASKGAYNIASSIAGVLLGHCKYFVAPLDIQAGQAEEHVFSISVDKNLVSHVDPETDVHSDNEFAFRIHEDNPASCFVIGGRMYFWNAENCCLDWIELAGAPDFQRFAAVTYDNLEDARDQIRPHNTTSGPPDTQTAGHPIEIEQVDFTPTSTPSPPNTTEYYQPVDCPTHELMFGVEAKREDIDNWVDKAATTRQLCTRDGRIECPEAGCTASSRRPHALKDHLYTHYDIRRE